MKWHAANLVTSALRLRATRFGESAVALAKAARRKIPRRSLCAFAALSATALAVGLWVRLGPISPELLDSRDTTSTMVVDRNGVPLYEALSGDGTRSVMLDAKDLPPLVVSATVAAEDRRFWSHAGVDPIAMMRALKRDLMELEFVEGGSTISQQVAKLLLNRQSPRRHRGIGGKLHEAILAMRLEHRFTKREILALYLNLAAYGNQVVGVERASRAYFGCPASLLTPAQAAFVAGLPQRPTGFNPYRAREAAMTRQRSVLHRMASMGKLSPDQLREARAERLVFTRQATPFKAPHFVEMVLAAAGDATPARIETTIDGELQAEIAGIIESQRSTLKEHGAGNVAVVVLDNERGEWLAWEGSGNYFDVAHGGAINGPRVPRQPGSALKPFTYALAFENGFTPASVLPDIPSHFPTAEPGVLYTPRNYDGRYRGPLLARRALAGSENVPAVALASEVGVPNLVRFLSRAGFTTFDRTASYYGLGVTLGNAEVRLDELVAAYSAFARGGEWISPTYIGGAQRPAGHPLVSARTAFWITDVLSDADAREYVFGRGGSLDFPFHVAVKTGTSQAYHDNWTIGYSRHVTVGVWVGNFDRLPLRNSSGVTGAGPVFHAVMLAAERRFAVRFGEAPARDLVTSTAEMGVHSVEICALSGMTANAWCPARRREWIPTDDNPRFCSWHHLTDEGLLTVWPAEYRQWAMDSGVDRQGRPNEIAVVRAAREVRVTSLSISSPPDGATYSIDPTLRPEFQSLSLRAVTETPGPVEWTVDQRPLGTMASDRPASWSLAPGRHTFVVRDASGRSAESTIVVR
jgi:penicillin-binding protein 1C